MRTKRKLVPKSTMSGEVRGVGGHNAGCGNVPSDVPLNPEFPTNVCALEQRFSQSVAHDNPFENLCDGVNQRVEVPPNTNAPANMDIDVPNPQMSLGAQLQTENVTVNLSDSTSNNVTSMSTSQRFANDILQEQNSPPSSRIPSAYKYEHVVMNLVSQLESCTITSIFKYLHLKQLL
ncbi:hypothetical protein Tco_0469524 [Tanacetum coccineum]